ncbi:MAG TPA: hypothetical protein VGJ97_10795 [Anaerolineaceae bacterium]|jgi:hypothetical protein
MPDTRAVFFWMGGVVTQAIEPLLSQALAVCGHPGMNLLARPGFAEVCADLALGRRAGLDFCGDICALAGADCPAEELDAALISAFAPAAGVINTIDRLPPVYQRWLIVDIPREWYEPICERLCIQPAFPEGQVIFLPESGLPRLLPDVFDFLAARAQLRMDQCLVLDRSSHRAVAALDHGFPSAIFVDARRLAREFVLRQFTARVPLEHRPATVIQPPSHHP